MGQGALRAIEGNRGDVYMGKVGDVAAASAEDTRLFLIVDVCHNMIVVVLCG